MQEETTVHHSISTISFLNYFHYFRVLFFKDGDVFLFKLPLFIILFNIYLIILFSYIIQRRIEFLE